MSPRSPVQSPRSTRADTRRTDIDTLRAFACLALVSFHVVGDTPAAGLELPSEHWLQRLNATFVDIRMPLFSFLSGYVFVVLAPKGALGAWTLRRMAAKVRRLLLPLIVVGTLFWLVRSQMGGAQQSLWTIYVLPYAHFWYLQATILIMASFLGLIWAMGGQSRNAAWALFVGGLVLWLVVPRFDLNLFSYADALRLSFFFAAGFLAAAYWPKVDAAMRPNAQRSIGLAVLLVALMLGSMLAQGIWVPETAIRTLCVVVVGLGSCLAFLMIRPEIGSLAWLGPYSYAIFLFHVFFTAGAREAVTRVMPELPIGVFWLIGMVAGLIGPIIVQRLVLLHPVSAWLTLGLRLKGRS